MSIEQKTNTASSTLILVSGPPSSQETLRALELAATLSRGRRRVSLFLIQDAVLGAVKNGGSEVTRSLERLCREGLDCYYLEEDLRLRGFRPEDVLPGVGVADYPKLVRLMEENDRTIGAF